MTPGTVVYGRSLGRRPVRVLGVPGWLPGVPMLNSWGKNYPHLTLLLDEAGERLLREDGEMAVVTDR